MFGNVVSYFYVGEVGMKRSSLPVISLVCGILSYVMMPFVLGIVAWVTGNMAIGQMDAGEISSDERSVAKIGKVLGIINVILCLVGFCLGLLFFGGLLAAIGISARPQ